MQDCFRFWGFAPDEYMQCVGANGAIGHPVDASNRCALFGRVELTDELLELCGPLTSECQTGWWSWLVLDEDATATGKPLAYFQTADQGRIPIITRTNDRDFRFWFDVDASIEFIQNEQYMAPNTPLYVRLGVNPDSLPGWLRRGGFASMNLIRKLRRGPKPVFPRSPADPSADVWKIIVRNLVERYQGGAALPLWPGSKQYAVTLTADIDTNHSFTNKSAFDQLISATDEADFHAAWFVVGQLFEQGRCTLDSLHHAGHEIACHGLYHDHRIASLPLGEIRDRFRQLAKMIEHYEIVGFRSPSYLHSSALFSAMDGQFAYDMSMHDVLDQTSGLSNKREGCSTCFPFRVRNTDVLEIPTNVPEDWNLALSGLPPRSFFTKQVSALQRIKSIGGVASFCVHAEAELSLRPDWLNSYREAMRWLAADDSVWVATPAEIARHWQKRQSNINLAWENFPATKPVESPRSWLYTSSQADGKLPVASACTEVS